MLKLFMIFVLEIFSSFRKIGNFRKGTKTEHSSARFFVARD